MKTGMMVVRILCGVGLIMFGYGMATNQQGFDLKGTGLDFIRLVELVEMISAGLGTGLALIGVAILTTVDFSKK